MPALQKSKCVKTVNADVDNGRILAASYVEIYLNDGRNITATATLTAIEGRKLQFTITASDEEGIIGEGEHTRFVVDREKFMARLG